MKNLLIIAITALLPVSTASAATLFRGSPTSYVSQTKCLTTPVYTNNRYTRPDYIYKSTPQHVLSHYAPYYSHRNEHVYYYRKPYYPPQYKYRQYRPAPRIIIY